jgi:predicted Zn-dependent protease
MMKPLIVFLLFLPAAYAQLPGFGGIKDKLDDSKRKTAPVTDRAQRAVDTFTPWTSEEEQQVGRAAAEKLVAVFGMVPDAALEKYVNLTGVAVAQFASRDLPWRFGILDTNIVGAFALPGGFIFITRGSLSGMTSEAQLAGALGHEIEHASARHLEAEIRSRKTSAWATEEAMARTHRGPAELKSRANALVKDLFSTALSRSKENDADDQGARMAAKAGYAQNGLLQFLTVAAASNADPKNRRFFGQLLATHPPFEERIARLAKSGSTRGKTLETRFRSALRR